MSINAMIQGYNNQYAQGTIDANGSLSQEIDLGNFTRIALMGENFTAGSLTFLVAHKSGGPYAALRNLAGTLLVTGSLTSPFAIDTDSMKILASYRYVKILTSATQSGGAPTFTFVEKA